MRKSEMGLKRLAAQANPPKVAVVFLETGESGSDAIVRGPRSRCRGRELHRRLLATGDEDL